MSSPAQRSNAPKFIRSASSVPLLSRNAGDPQILTEEPEEITRSKSPKTPRFGSRATLREQATEIPRWGKDIHNGSDLQGKHVKLRFGQLLPPDAPVWRDYIEEATERDEELISRWNTTMDVLLIFSGLFSAVLTAFLVQTIQQLSRDTLQDQVFLLNAIATRLAQPDSTSPLPTLPEFKASRSSVWINSLWFASLTFTLSASLAAIVMKQLIQMYRSDLRTGTLEEQALRHQHRAEALKAWHIGGMIEAIPSILYIALALFLAGMIVFLFTANTIVGSIIAALGLVSAILFVSSLFWPILDPNSPFRSPFSQGLTLWIYHFIPEKRRELSSLWYRYTGKLIVILPPAVKSVFEIEESKVKEDHNHLVVSSIAFLVGSHNDETTDTALESIAGIQDVLEKSGVSELVSQGIVRELEFKSRCPVLSKIERGNWEIPDSKLDRFREITPLLHSWAMVVRQVVIDFYINKVPLPLTNEMIWSWLGQTRDWHDAFLALAQHDPERIGWARHGWGLDSFTIVLCLCTYFELLDQSSTLSLRRLNSFLNSTDEGIGSSVASILADALSLTLLFQTTQPQEKSLQLEGQLLRCLLTLSHQYSTCEPTADRNLSLALVFLAKREQPARVEFYKLYLEDRDTRRLQTELASQLFSLHRTSEQLDPLLTNQISNGIGKLLISLLPFVTLKLIDGDDIDHILDILPNMSQYERVRLIGLLYKQPLRSLMNGRKIARWSFELLDFQRKHTPPEEYSPSALALLGKLVKKSFGWYSPSDMRFHETMHAVADIFLNCLDSPDPDIADQAAFGLSAIPLYWYSNYPIAPWKDPAAVQKLANFFVQGKATDVTIYEWAITLNHRPRAGKKGIEWNKLGLYSTYTPWMPYSSDAVQRDQGLQRNDKIYQNHGLGWDEDVFKTLISALLPQLEALEKRAETFITNNIGRLDTELIDKLKAYVDQ